MHRMFIPYHEALRQENATLYHFRPPIRGHRLGTYTWVVGDDLAALRLGEMANDQVEPSAASEGLAVLRYPSRNPSFIPAERSLTFA